MKVWSYTYNLYLLLQISLYISLLVCVQLPNKQQQLGFCTEQEEEDPTSMATLGGVKDSSASSQNSVELDSLARFAVDQHNEKENALLEFARVVKAKEQVVAGTLHHLTVEVIDAGTKKLYEAKIWVKPWMDFKELQEFKHVDDCPSITPSDLGVKKGDHPPGWQSVPVHDPVVKDAADHAIKTIQQRSNSLIPYQLQEIVYANAEVIEESAKFDILLKVSRGDKEEKLKVEVHKNDGAFKLNHMAPHNE